MSAGTPAPTPHRSSYQADTFHHLTTTSLNSANSHLLIMCDQFVMLTLHFNSYDFMHIFLSHFISCFYAIFLLMTKGGERVKYLNTEPNTEVKEPFIYARTFFKKIIKNIYALN